MLKIKLPKNRVQFLIDELERRIKPAVLERGWEYFHRGLVHNINLVHGCSLQADIRGKEMYRTSLDLEQFDRSDCTCPYDGCCKHMAALVFYAYSSHGRAELLLMQLKQSINSRKRTNKNADLLQRTEKTVRELTPANLPKDWIRYFDQKFHGFSLTNQHSVEQFHQAVWETLGPKSEGWPEELQQLYWLHLTLYVMRKIDQFHQENQSSYLSYYIENGCKLVAGKAWDKLHAESGGWSPEAIKQAVPSHWKATLSMIAELVTRNKPGPVRWLDVYRFLWSKLLLSSEAAEQEQKRLELLLEQPQLLPRMKDSLLLARAYFDVLQGNDQAAMKRLEELHNRQFSDFDLMLGQLAEKEEWNRLLEWLRYLLPVLAKAKQEEFNKGCVYWLESMKHRPSDEEWIRVMLSLLPRSYYYYTDYLIQTKRYRQWVDLQLAVGVSPANLYTAELRTVEGHNPELLLPLYHQAVEKAILEKNRDSYKLAARQLKKLHSIYQQIGQPDRWDEYFEKLSAKFARLRAFKEELSKGKWTS